MTSWNPIWRVLVNGVNSTTTIFSNLTITSGRTNIYSQPYAGYCTVNINNTDHSTVSIAINDAVTIEVKNNAGTYVTLFGGTVVDLGIAIREIGNTYTQTVTITALGALSRLPRATTTGVLSSGLDGAQILTILQDLLLNNWSEVPAALTWATYTPAGTTWATAENVGLGTIDAGNYTLAARSSSVDDDYSIVTALATSGLGYIWESADGLINYADSTHRSTYLATYGYTELSANDALGAGMKIQTRAGDVRNDITIKYGATSSSSYNTTDAVSIDTYGRLAQIVTTTLANLSDATTQGAFYLKIRATPYANLETITYELTNGDIDTADRDSLLGVFIGLPVSIADIPTNMGGTYLGFIEGWTWRANFNQLSITATLSPLIYSLQAMKWSDVGATERWNTVAGTLQWQDAFVVA